MKYQITRAGKVVANRDDLAGAIQRFRSECERAKKYRNAGCSVALTQGSVCVLSFVVQKKR